MLQEHDDLSPEAEDDQPTIDLARSEEPEDTVAESPPLPERIGCYRILDNLGEGGMGIVYLAEQTEPVQRQVALKVMRDALRDRESLLRFTAERQALARLQHVTVAQMFEAGTTDDGHPFFAMELIDGMPIISYCDQHKMTVRERLALFCAVCEGVQHAHQKGILHRDLTPANILVTKVDGRPVPKIIDFGIAKALDQPLVDGTLLTAGRVIGTPAYLSPEAIDGGSDEVDTRSDVYSLGVLLYELLVGVRPFETRGEKLIKVLHRIVDEEPTGPSTRWTTLAANDKERIAAQRGLDIAALKKRLRGDLDWIVLKAIAKDRNQRYGSPAEMAADITRHLRHQPVEASPPSTIYRFGKFVRRHRGLVAVLLLLALAGFKYTYDLRREQQRTLSALAEAEQARSQAQQVSDFLVDVFEVSDPGQARGDEITAREVLDRGAERLEHELADQPLVRARLFDTIAAVYDHLGLYQEAATMQQRSIGLLRGEHSGDHKHLASALHRMGEIWYMLDQYDESAEMFEESLAMRRRLYPEEHPAIASSHEEIGRIRFDQGRFDEARSLLESSLSIRRQTLDANDPELADSLWLLADILSYDGEVARAEAHYQETIRIFETALGPDHPTLATALEGFGSLYLHHGRSSEAAPLFRRSMAIREKTLPPDHPNLAISASYLGYVCFGEGRFDEGERYMLKALGIFERALGKDHFNVGANLLFLADLYFQTGRYDECEATYQRSLEIWQGLGLADGANATTARIGLAELAAARRAWGQAEKGFREILKLAEDTLELDDQSALSLRIGLAESVLRQRRFSEAEELLVEVLDEITDVDNGTPEQGSKLMEIKATAEACLGQLRNAQGDTEAANVLWLQVHTSLDSLKDADSSFAILALRAKILLLLDQHQLAAPLIEQLSAIGWIDPELEQLKQTTAASASKPTTSGRQSAYRG
jgi:non-specific serine/threonine protein kinase/serine/threonine-protein kinase